MDGYSVKDAASVLGIPKRRVWELIARGVLSGAPEGDGGMRVFLQPRPGRPSPLSAKPAEPPRTNGNGGGHAEPSGEGSPFREMLTEFRSLTERYGQALLALGEARGEVSALRSRVDLLEARLDLRLPGPRPSSTVAWEMPEYAPPAPVEPAFREAAEPLEPPEAAEPSEALATPVAPESPELAEPRPARAVRRSRASKLKEVRAVETTSETGNAAVDAQPAAPTSARGPESPDKGASRRRRALRSHSAIAGITEALARAQDPTLADLPGAREAAEALAALQREVEARSATLETESSAGHEAQVEVAAETESSAGVVAEHPDLGEVEPESEFGSPSSTEPGVVEASFIEPAVATLAEELVREEALPEERPAKGVAQVPATGADEPDSGPDVAVLELADREEVAAEAASSPYTTEVVEPDWFADGDFAWLEAAQAEPITTDEAAPVNSDRIEAERVEAEAKAARIEAERIEAEAEAARIEAERIEADRIEAERVEAEAKAARIEAERIEAEGEAARIEAERIETERIEAQAEAARVEAERIEAEAEAARVEAERIEAERNEAERIEAEAEAARVEAERIEAERNEAERIEAEAEAARIEAERIEAERIEAKRIEAERIEAERIAAERIEAKRIEAERIEAERIAAEQIEAERVETERVETEQAEAEAAADTIQVALEGGDAEALPEAEAKGVATLERELEAGDSAATDAIQDAFEPPQADAPESQADAPTATATPGEAAFNPLDVTVVTVDRPAPETAETPDAESRINPEATSAPPTESVASAPTQAERPRRLTFRGSSQPTIRPKVQPASAAPATGRPAEEELMWLGDEFEEAGLEVAAQGWRSEPDASVGKSREASAHEMSDSDLEQLAQDEGWEADEVDAIRTLLGRPNSPQTTPTSVAITVDESEPPDDVHPMDEAPSAAQDSPAPMTVQAEPMPPPENGEAEPMDDGPPPAAAIAAQEGDIESSPPSGPSAERPATPPVADSNPERRAAAPEPEWLRRRRGPAATAYRRLRRLLPG